MLNQTGTTINDYLFAGEQFDRNLGQSYLRARYYDPTIGRFTQMDTWMGNSSDPVTLHKYLYANANPVMFTDPTGNFGLSEVSVVNNIVGVLANMQVNNAFNVFEIRGVDDPNIDSARTATFLLSLASISGAGKSLSNIVSRTFSSLKSGARFKTLSRGLFGSVASVKPRSLDKLSPAIGKFTITASNIGSLTQGVVYNYVITESNKLVVSPRGNKKSGQKHTQLTGGAPAKAAGEIFVNSKGAVSINNQSGRYRAQNGSSVKRVKAMFSLMGISAKIVGGAF